MSVISFASSKGGAGKTTCAIVLATTLARTHDVTLIDADPTRRLMSWARKAPLPERLTARDLSADRSIEEDIAEAKLSSKFVIVDLPGTQSRTNARAMGESDLVIIPMADEQPDAEAVIETLNRLEQEEDRRKREIPYRILFCRTLSSSKSPPERKLNAEVRRNLESFDRELYRCDAFSMLHRNGGTLLDIDANEVPDVVKAKAYADLFVEEFLSKLKQSRPARNRNATMQMSVRMKPEVYERFREIAETERRTNGDMLERMMDFYETADGNKAP